jgi:hypothetical protein
LNRCSRIVREQFGKVRPQPFVEIIAVGLLQLLDGRHIFGQLDLRLQPVEARIERGIIGGGRGRAGNSRHDSKGGGKPDSHEVPRS